MKDLKGDRQVEDDFMINSVGNTEGDLLDIGCLGSRLPSVYAVNKELNVLAIDQRKGSLIGSGYEFRQADILNAEFDRKFDIISMCSVLEHIGLPGRYDSVDDPDGDIKVMSKVRELLTLSYRPGGKLIMTIPIGVDNVMENYHRVYGVDRLPLIFNDWMIEKEKYYIKDDNNKWIESDYETAINEVPTLNPSYYAIGCFVLGVE